MSDWLTHTESLRLTLLSAYQDVLVGTCTPAEAAERLDAKLAEVSAN
jgi:raffinose/stachyose/melibiose transport system substrate-binding protein